MNSCLQSTGVAYIHNLATFRGCTPTRGYVPVYIRSAPAYSYTQREGILVDLVYVAIDTPYCRLVLTGLGGVTRLIVQRVRLARRETASGATAEAAAIIAATNTARLPACENARARNSRCSCSVVGRCGCAVSAWQQWQRSRPSRLRFWDLGQVKRTQFTAPQWNCSSSAALAAAAAWLLLESLLLWAAAPSCESTEPTESVTAHHSFGSLTRHRASRGRQ